MEEVDEKDLDKIRDEYLDLAKKARKEADEKEKAEAK